MLVDTSRIGSDRGIQYELVNEVLGIAGSDAVLAVHVRVTGPVLFLDGTTPGICRNNRKRSC
jgi:hypothetical protein